MFSNLCLIYFMGIVVLKETIGFIKNIVILVMRVVQKYKKKLPFDKNKVSAI